MNEGRGLLEVFDGQSQRPRQLTWELPQVPGALAALL